MIEMFDEVSNRAGFTARARMRALPRRAIQHVKRVAGCRADPACTCTCTGSDTAVDVIEY